MKPTLNNIKETDINVVNIEWPEHFYHEILGLEVFSKMTDSSFSESVRSDYEDFF